MSNTTLLSTDQLLDLMNSCYQHLPERTVSIEKTDKMLMYSIEDDNFYTANAFNIWDTIDPVKGIEDNLISTKTDYALSANQGRILKEAHDSFYDEFLEAIRIIEEEFIVVHNDINALDVRTTAIETELVTKANYKFYKNITDRDIDIPNVKKGTIAITEDVNSDIDISILNEDNVYIKDSTYASKDLTNIDNNVFKNKGVDAGLLYRIPNVQQELNLYVTDYIGFRNTFILSEVKPTMDMSMDWTIDDSYNVKTFEFRYTDFRYLSTSSRYTLSLNVSNIEANSDYIITAITKYTKDRMDWEIGNTEYTTRFPISNVTIEIPLENNQIGTEIELAPETRFYVDLQIKKANGASETITITSTPAEPSRLVRNSFSIGSNNVFDYNGTNTKSLAYRLDELKTSHNEFIPKTEKRQPNGVACLDENGKIHTDELPSFILGQVLYGGTVYNSDGNCSVSDSFKSKYGKDYFTITLLNAREVEGTYFIASFSGTILGLIVQVGDWLISNGVNGWAKIVNTDAVTMVNGRVGNIVLSKSDVGLTNVDNTSDALKRVAYADIAGSASASDVHPWAKQAAKPAYTAAEVGLGNVNNTADSNKSVNYANTAGSAVANDVYAWAKQPNKPAYNAAEVGAVAVFANGKTNSIYSEYIGGGGKCRPVDLEQHSTTVRMGASIGGLWCDQLMMNAYTDADVPYRTAFAIKKQYGIQAFVATGHTTATIWNVAELWHNSNLPNPFSKNTWNTMNGEAGQMYVGEHENAGDYTIRQCIAFKWYNSHAAIGILRDGAAGTRGIGFYINSGVRAYFDINGALNCPNVIFSSDENIKENFKSFDDFNIDDIRLEWFNMKDDKDSKRFGVIAQDVMKYVPEFVSGKEWSKDEPNRHLSVANIDLLFLMIAKLRKDVKELKQKQTE